MTNFKSTKVEMDIMHAFTLALISFKNGNESNAKELLRDVFMQVKDKSYKEGFIAGMLEAEHNFTNKNDEESGA